MINKLLIVNEVMKANDVSLVDVISECFEKLDVLKKDMRLQILKEKE